MWLYLVYSSVDLLCKLTARSESLSCTFDDGYCDWNQDVKDEFDWIRTNKGTRTSETGPNSDHTTGDLKGYYIYTAASDSNTYGDKARLISRMQEQGPYCFMFWYSMYGEDIGTLNVYMVPKNTLIFTKSGNIGDRDWRMEAISYNASAKYQIMLEGVRGNGTKGDIAVDDISMTSGICSIAGQPSGYIGCFKDSRGKRVLPKRLYTSSSKNNGEYCKGSCSSAGYRFAGTAYGSECWCGNQNPGEPLPSDNECNWPCRSNRGELCGGLLHISIYDTWETTTVLPSIETETSPFSNSSDSITTTGKYNLDSGNTSALIAVYVVVSVVATAVCIMLLAVFWRKCISRGDEKEQAIQGSQNTDTRTINFSNVEALQSNPGSTYTDLINPSYVNAIQSQEHEYTSIKIDGSEKRTDEKSVYYNTVEAVISRQ